MSLVHMLRWSGGGNSVNYIYVYMFVCVHGCIYVCERMLVYLNMCTCMCIYSACVTGPAILV